MPADLILKLVALSVAKKVSVFLIARTYGFSRLYRRMMRANRFVFASSPTTRHKVSAAVQYSFRLPRFIAERFRSCAAPTSSPPSRPPPTQPP
mmetsp:Transcript_4184/g.11470  ORF Transcript_4184/g.11470 Transcript_4184/m.11470 type:complete len:93 (-) Transcript_4184:254-532(-)